MFFPQFGGSAAGVLSQFGGSATGVLSPVWWIGHWCSFSRQEEKKATTTKITDKKKNIVAANPTFSSLDAVGPATGFLARCTGTGFLAHRYAAQHRVAEIPHHGPIVRSFVQRFRNGTDGTDLCD